MMKFISAIESMNVTKMIVYVVHVENTMYKVDKV